MVTRPNALRRILMNLIDNALKLGSDVRVQVRVDTERIVVSIVDKGPGIPPISWRPFSSPSTVWKAPEIGRAHV